MDVCYVISRFQCINVLCVCERDVSVQAAVSVSPPVTCTYRYDSEFST